MVDPTKKLTPKQLQLLMDELMKLYTQAYVARDEGPHYEHIIAGKRRFKVGYHFDNPSPSELISIRIVDKGEV